MYFISKESELSSFINEKCMSPQKLILKNVLVNYAKILKDTILTTYRKFKNPIWSNEAIHIITHVYWQTIYYSFNIHLSMFLSDRAITLFNEYIELAKSSYSDKTNFNISKTDIKLFIYKRTIGPINTHCEYENLSIINHLKRIEHVAYEFLRIIQKLFVTLIQYFEYNTNIYEPFSIKEDQLILYIDYIDTLYINILYKLSLYKKYNVVSYNWKLINAILNKCVETNDIFLSYLNLILNIIKIEYELLYYITTTYKELHLEISYNLGNILCVIRNELTIEDIIFKKQYFNIYDELSNMLSDMQIIHIHELLLYKELKTYILKLII
jgi:hypothetical protein